MNYIKIEGIEDAYPERIEGTSEWYCCKIATNCFCDLYEAEEIVKLGNVYEGMTCVLIHYPDGQVYYPFVAKENVYVEKMVVGRLNKFYKEVCLEEQAFIKDSGVSVKDYVKNNGGEIVSMVRFAVGEGIEKKQEDFANEVMSQIQGA